MASSWCAVDGAGVSAAPSTPVDCAFLHTCALSGSRSVAANNGEHGLVQPPHQEHPAIYIVQGLGNACPNEYSQLAANGYLCMMTAAALVVVGKSKRCTNSGSYWPWLRPSCSRLAASHFRLLPRKELSQQLAPSPIPASTTCPWTSHRFLHVFHRRGASCIRLRDQGPESLSGQSPACSL